MMTTMGPHHLSDVYRGSYVQLRQTAARFVSHQDADDMVQEAFLRALVHNDRFRGHAAYTTWVYRILVNACLDMGRRQRRVSSLTVDEDHAAPRRRRSHRLIDRCALRSALAALDATQRHVCVMYDVMGYTHREIASRLGIPVGTSKGRLFAARRRLKRLLNA